MQRSGDRTVANLVQHKGKELVTLLSRSILLVFSSFFPIFSSSIQHGTCNAIPWCHFLSDHLPNPTASSHLTTTRWEPFWGAHLSQCSALHSDHADVFVKCKPQAFRLFIFAFFLTQPRRKVGDSCAAEQGTQREVEDRKALSSGGRVSSLSIREK